MRAANGLPQGEAATQSRPAAAGIPLACIITPRRSLQLHSHAETAPGCGLRSHGGGYSSAARRRSAGRAEDVADKTSPTTSPAMAKRQRKSTSWSLESADTPQGAPSL